MPGLLVGDGHLGGISTTIGAQECLLLRGYDLAAIVLMDSGLANWKYLREHFGGRVPVIGLPPCSPPPQTSCAFQTSNPLCCIAAAFFLWSQKHAALKPRIMCLSANLMSLVRRSREGGIDEALQEWLEKTRQPMAEIRGLLQRHHDNRGILLLRIFSSMPLLFTKSGRTVFGHACLVHHF